MPFRVTKGEPVFISYGKYSNAKLLFTYGFVDPSTPFIFHAALIANEFCREYNTCNRLLDQLAKKRCIV